MRRREFITFVCCAAAASPLTARAQQDGRLWRVGHLRASPPPEAELEAFLQGMVAGGMVQGRHFLLIPKWGDGNPARLSEFAIELVNSGVDIIVAEGFFSGRAARAVTSSIPIVISRTPDPYVGGLIKNLARPGGNVSGFASLTADIAGKTFELLREMVPTLTHIASLAPRVARAIFDQPESEAARALGLELIQVDLAKPEEIAITMTEAVSKGAQGGVLRGSPFFSSVQRKMIVDSAAEHRLPMIYEAREFVVQGGLMTYSADGLDLNRRAASYVVKILEGAKPGELPMQQASKFDLVINLKAAIALRLDMPPTLLARADEVIE